MKNLFAFLLVGVSFCGYSQSENPLALYEKTIKGYKGDSLNLGELRNTKIIVMVVDGQESNLEQLFVLDSVIFSMKGNYMGIVIPVSDFEKPGKKAMNYDALKNLKNVFISKIAKAGKKNGGQQHPLLKWLSTRQENGHFDFDFTKSGQVFLINPNGMLYGTFLYGLDLRSETFLRALSIKCRIAPHR
jgi:glutathione peroxidase